MNSKIDAEIARSALRKLPEGTSHGKKPVPRQVYLPRSHLKAMDPDVMLVTGMRGAGKTFWWSALQEPAIRELIYKPAEQLASSESTEVKTGFGVTDDPDKYPNKDGLRTLLSNGQNPRMIWQTVLARQIASPDHPIQRPETWHERLVYVANNPEAISRLFQDADEAFARECKFLLVLFDALDRCSDEWKDIYPLVRGLMQTALDMRSYRRLRVKIFLRTDQMVESRITDFPDASKVLSSTVELGWPTRELYGLLWHNLVNSEQGEVFRDFLGHRPWSATSVAGCSLFQVPRQLVSDEESQRSQFHMIAGPWMGRNAKRGFPYTWIPNHLADTKGQVSPRSFLKALQTAAEDADERYPDHSHALHFESIKRGVQEASRIRVEEVKEDYPWMHRALKPLAGIMLPCGFDEIKERWREDQVLECLARDVKEGGVELPPSHLENGANGVREDLESLGVFQRLHDGRVNIPDVFRVGYGLGRKGGVKPARWQSSSP